MTKQTERVEQAAEMLTGTHAIYLGDAYGDHPVQVSPELARHLAGVLSDADLLANNNVEDNGNLYFGWMLGHRYGLSDGRAEIRRAVEAEYCAEVARLGETAISESPLLQNWIGGLKTAMRVAGAAGSDGIEPTYPTGITPPAR